MEGVKNNKKLFLLGSKNGTSQNTEYEVQKICTFMITRKANFSQPKFLPFFSNNKEAGKNFSYSDTLCEIIKNSFCPLRGI
jgi:hypothetical protein